MIGEIAAKCQQNDIDFYLYYNTGLGNGEWGEAQNYPASVNFHQTGRGDKTTFIKNWIDVITEVGVKLGDKLDGWMFDDAPVYYPAPFESMAAAAKAGNSNRIISYNAPVGIRPTEFQDFIFGENSWGEEQDTTDGILNSGGQKGLLQIGLPMLNTGGASGGWGIVSENEPIGMTQSNEILISKVESAHQRKVPMALSIKMWEGGVLSEDTWKQLFALRDARYPEMADTVYLPKELEISAPYETISIFDSMPLAVSFKPQYATSRDVTWTVTELDGSPTDKATISADGVISGRGVLGKVKVRAQSKVNSSVYDELIVQFDINLRLHIRPNDTGITYQGTWHSGTSFRYTYNASGSSATYTFNGHGIEWYGVTGSDHGMAAVYIDDELVQTVDCYTEDRQEDTLIFKIDNLSSGQHTIKIVSLDQRNPLTTNTFVEIYKFIVERRVDVNSPFASPPAGQYRGEQEITLITSRSNATIHYTLDGSEPNAQSRQYTAPIKISQDTVIKAITLVNGSDPSEVSILEYLIDLNDPDETPLLDDATGISLYGITGAETPLDGYLHIRDVTPGKSALNAIKALAGDMAVLKYFQIGFLDVRGKKDMGQITGPCVLSIPVPKGKDYETLAVYTIDENGAATLLDTFYDDETDTLTGYILSSELTFALIEKIKTVPKGSGETSGGTTDGKKTDKTPIIVPTVPEEENHIPADGILTLEEFRRIVGESDSDIISLVVEQGTVFTADMQREIAGTGKMLQFKIRDEGTIVGIWIFNDINEIMEDIDLSLNIVSENVSLIERLITNADSYIILSTVYHGQVHPGTMLLVQNEKSMKKHDDLSLLFFNSEADKLEKLNNNVVLTNDLAFIGSTFDHFSEYVIQKNKAPVGGRSPVHGKETGFPWLILWITVGVLAAGGAAVVTIVFIKNKKTGGKPSC